MHAVCRRKIPLPEEISVSPRRNTGRHELRLCRRSFPGSSATLCSVRAYNFSLLFRQACSCSGGSVLCRAVRSGSAVGAAGIFPVAASGSGCPCRNRCYSQELFRRPCCEAQQYLRLPPPDKARGTNIHAPDTLSAVSQAYRNEVQFLFKVFQRWNVLRSAGSGMSADRSCYNPGRRKYRLYQGIRDDNEHCFRGEHFAVAV